MTAWWYWLILAFALSAWLAVPIVHRWEQHQDRLDREAWERLHGGDIYSRRVDP